MFWRSQSDSTPSTPALGSCGYPQRFVEALAQLESDARTKQLPATIILFSIDNLPMFMIGYSLAVAEAVL